MQQHGFARNLDWAIGSTSADAQPDDRDPEVTLVLTDNEYTRKMWCVGGGVCGGGGWVGGGGGGAGRDWGGGGERGLGGGGAPRDAHIVPSRLMGGGGSLPLPPCRPHAFKVAYSIALHGAPAGRACLPASPLPAC